MSKKVKSLVVNEIKSRFENVNEMILVSTRGIDGKISNKMRGELLSKKIHMNTVKNSLAKMAFKATSREAMANLLDGPTTLVYGGESIVDVVKELMEWTKKCNLLQIKGGFLEGQALDAAKAAELAKMPNRAELLGSIVTIAKSPGSRVAAATLAPGGAIAGCLKTLIEKKEKEAPAAA